MSISVVMLCILLFSMPTRGEEENNKEGLPTIAVKTKNMVKQGGLLDYYWDEQSGTVWLEISKLDQDLLYVNRLTYGLGSNDIGLDRGQMGRTRIVRFKRVGPKVLLVQKNTKYRATTGDVSERRAVEESFARSVLWGFKAGAEEEGRVLVDATAFFLRDVHGVTGRLDRQDQGKYKLEDSRSFIYLPRTRNFPKNTEVEAALTFTSPKPGSYVRQVAASPEEITVHEHHSFVQLPDDGFKTRRNDPRSGYFGPVYFDLSQPIEKPVRQRLIARHRLRKKDPSADRSEPFEPIVYYVDNGAPEPIRSALVEGARWWNQAFEAAGYLDAFRVEVLPDTADLMDIRYNVIQWVHRSTRGWSYGGGVIDPRTGEIIKGNVTLGSLRVRQDFLIAQGLLSPYGEGEDRVEEMKAMALARIRQLSAHEVGHTLGIRHNFGASAFDRASVMDYPHPLITLGADGAPDLSDAYDVGIGAWDKVTIAYGYQDFPAGVDEAGALDRIIRVALDQGLYLITDPDARPRGGAHPTAHLWDNGPDATDELRHIMKVRAAALGRLSEHSIPLGTPLATLEEVLVPIYLLHRYQTEAAVKLIAGVDYRYALRGDGQAAPRPVSDDRQREALAALLETLAPEFLAIPESVVSLISPRPPGYGRTRELLPTRSGVAFDPISAAQSAVRIPVELLLGPERATRLVQNEGQGHLGFSEVVDKLIDTTWKVESRDLNHRRITMSAGHVVLESLMRLSIDPAASSLVRDVADFKLDELGAWCRNAGRSTRSTDVEAYLKAAARRISRFRVDPDQFTFPARPKLPPGSPIGDVFLSCGYPGEAR